MIKKLLFGLLSLFIGLQAMAEANYVYHELSTNNPGCGADNFVSTTNPTPGTAIKIAFKVEFQFYTTDACVYYTTDGTAPAGAKGVASGTSNVLTASFSCTFGSPSVDVWVATLPGQPTGTKLRYIIGAWHNGGGDEIFANGAGSPCGGGCGTVTNSSSLATVFAFPTILPVQLAAFSAVLNLAGTIQLNWKTTMELNLSHFEIEQSADGSHWVKVGTVVGINSGLGASYTFTEARFSGSFMLYRIKIIDKDGRAAYSQQVTIKSKAKANMELVSNPVKEFVTLAFHEPIATLFQVELMTASGSIISRTAYQHAGGSRVFTMQLANVAKGMYFLKVSSTTSANTFRLVVQ